jgi:hypothetical protein
MGRIKKNKHFKHPRSYYAEFVSFGLLIFMIIFACIVILQMSEEEVYKDYANPKMTGTAKGRFAQLLLMLIVRRFGKTGILILGIILIFLFLYALIQEIKEFKRYKYKCLLYHEGIIKDIYDIYDDYERQGLLTKIKNLFLRKNRNKYHYPTNKELKNIEDKMKNTTK